MKKLLMLILLFLLPVCAHAEYWDTTIERPVVCCDDRPGCQVLQAVMMGSFADFDPADSLNVRVLSAALPRLAAVEQDDFMHFTENFDVSIEALREAYYIALGNCFHSDLIVNPLVDDMDEQNARTVLGLFLNPIAEDAGEQMLAIRENCSEETILKLATHAKVPAEFVQNLLLKSEPE